MRIIFFSGSSSVGKSQALAQLSEDKYIKAPLSARDARATIGNPTWKDLMDNRRTAREHQEVVLKFFYESIMQQLEANKNDKRDIVFERSLWDVVGYSHAFNCGYAFVANQVIDVVVDMEEDISAYGEMHIVYFPVNPLIPYEAIEARPPILIRERQDNWLQMFLKEESSTYNKFHIRLFGESIEDCLNKPLNT